MKYFKKVPGEELVMAGVMKAHICNIQSLHNMARPVVATGLYDVDLNVTTTELTY